MRDTIRGSYLGAITVALCFSGAITSLIKAVELTVSPPLTSGINRVLGKDFPDVFPLRVDRVVWQMPIFALLGAISLGVVGFIIGAWLYGEPRRRWPTNGANLR